MNFREWSNPDNWDEDGNPKFREWHYEPSSMGHRNHRFPDWAFTQRPLYADEETIDLMIDHLERQLPVEFDACDKQFLHSVGMTP